MKHKQRKIINENTPVHKNNMPNKFRTCDLKKLEARKNNLSFSNELEFNRNSP